MCTCAGFSKIFKDDFYCIKIQNQFNLKKITLNGVIKSYLIECHQQYNYSESNLCTNSGTVQVMLLSA